MARARTSPPPVADFATATGIKIQIDSIGSSHETVLKTRIEGGKPPDIAQLAQPTPVLAYAAQGKVIDVAPFMDARSSAYEHANTIGLVTQDWEVLGVPVQGRRQVDRIWYPIKAFEAKGYTVPETWDELIALSDKIVADRSNPWCVSAGGPGTATGWQLTDWVEEVVLKTKGADYYNDWISHQVPFPGSGHQGRLRQVRRQDLLHAELRLRHQHKHRPPATRRDGDGPHASPRTWPTQKC